MRNKLSDRRRAATQKVLHRNALGAEEEYLVTFGFDGEGTIREVFCADPRVGSDMHALLTDGCILISIYLQTGGEPERLVKSMGENRAEGESGGPPSSVFGAVARAILAFQQELHE